MSNNVYAISEIAGSSPNSIEEAVEGAVATASKKLNNLDWFEVNEIRGHIENGKVGHYQVVVKIGFRYEQ